MAWDLMSPTGVYVFVQRLREAKHGLSVVSFQICVKDLDIS